MTKAQIYQNQLNRAMTDYQNNDIVNNELSALEKKISDIEDEIKLLENEDEIKEKEILLSEAKSSLSNYMVANKIPKVIR